MRSFKAALVCAAILTCGLIGPARALASPSRQVTIRSVQPPSSAQFSSDFAGYTIGFSSTSAAVISTDFTVPKRGYCSDQNVPGGVVFTPLDLGVTLLNQQVYSPAGNAVVEVSCDTDDTTATFTMETNAGGPVDSAPVNPGDAIQVVIQSLDGATTSTVADATTGAVVSATGPSDIQTNSVFALGAVPVYKEETDSDSTPMNLPVYGPQTTVFHDTQIDGVPLAQVSPAPAPYYTRLDSPSVIRPEPLTPKTPKEMSIKEKQPEQVVNVDCGFYHPNICHN